MSPIEQTITVGTQSWLNAIGVGSFVYVGATELVVDAFTRLVCLFV
jgi:hypothetical protein